MTASGEQRSYQPLGQKIGLYVAWPGSEELASAMRCELAARLQADTQFAEVEVLKSLPESSDFPLLAVEIVQQDLRWTPVYSRSRLTTNLTYASDGDISWRHQQSMVMSNASGLVVWLKGKHVIEDTTSGLTSLPAYQRHLRKQVEVEVLKSVQSAIAKHAE